MAFINANRFAEEMFILGIVWLKVGYPCIRGSNDILCAHVEQTIPCVMSVETLRGTQLFEQLRRCHAGEIEWPDRRTVSGLNAPDAATSLVPSRIPVAGLVMADDGVVPVAHVNGAIR